MKHDTRRNLLAKLGVGAAAITTMSATGTAAAGPRKKTVARHKVSAHTKKVQVNVGIARKGIIVQSKAIEGKTALRAGLTKNNHILQLGVEVHDNGMVDIKGLESVLNRGAHAASDGRCVYGSSKYEQVSNPADLLRVDTAKLGTF